MAGITLPRAGLIAGRFSTMKPNNVHFIELLGEMVERFRVLVHAHVELDNHYHLILQTPEANLSQAIQWLNISYAVWVNRRRERVGPLMQGRFKSIPIEDSAWAYELSLYVAFYQVMRHLAQT